MYRYFMAAVAVVAFASLAQAIEPVLAEGEKRITEGQEAQQKVQAMAANIDSLSHEYRTVGKELDGLNVYNSLLQQQLDSQQSDMDALQESISQVAVVERQIIPLMMRMIDALDKFISLDVPFLLEERTGRVQRLRAMMPRPDVSVPEKLRRVLEAFQIENEYGRTLEAYRGSLEVAGSEREVDFLRIGRIALLAQTTGGEHSVAWFQGQWLMLSPELYEQHIAKGLQIARKQVAPDLLWLPLPPAETVGL